MLEIDDLSVRFRGVHAVRSVTARVEEGAVVGLIGPNGAGKSTLVNCVAGTVRPASGAVRWRGARLDRLSGERIAAHGVARTYQHARLFHGHTVLDNVMTGAHRLGSCGMLRAMVRAPGFRRDETRIRDRAEEALAAVGAHHLAMADVGDLTAGQQRLVAVARALASRPDLLLLDEPAAGLTDAERDALLADLRRYFAEHRVSGLVIEHHLGFLMELVTDVIVLVRGSVLTRGAPDDVRADPAVIEAYIGV
ncbi:ABC transporter ATP-binding protein [Actinomadura chibensis]|uniref:ABC transporter ATP-binding protein n=1 Tax=Actinomadura chibensis TaxID=392828 RepID=A0A5D0N9R7_9ACTN|nr:ABC transporter ATP-binding protein [Actinomadura chibensis]TYB41059.1 ABC transporter ATP-binding protein [Actinomadura chibensis]